MRIRLFVNSLEPHIGHLYTCVLADASKRWAEMSKKRALLFTGTDEHGIKVFMKTN